MMAEKVDKTKHTTISIPKTLFELLEEKTESTGFSSVSAYCTYILRETMIRMMQDELKKHKDGKKDGEVIEKMRKLGYI
jgi:hypothetical protein